MSSSSFFLQAEDGIRYLVRSRGLGDVYKRQLKDSMPYQHEMNDALVKMHLNSVQFAKDNGLVGELSLIHI